MKILWIVNNSLPMFAKQNNIKNIDTTGWLTGYASNLKDNVDIELVVAFPLLASKSMLHGEISNIEYFSFHQPKLLNILRVPSLRISNRMRKDLSYIIEKVNPDVLHIFGTEFRHSLLAAKLFNKPNKTIVSIQGLTTFIAKHYYSELPFKVIYKFNFSSFFRGTIKKQRDIFKKRSVYEKELIRFTNHIIGRTYWDKICVESLNNSVVYHKCNESLRNGFYTKKWNINKIIRHQIFISQASYPIKGLHFVLEAIKDLVYEYPDIKLMIAGNNFINNNTLKAKLKRSTYGSYINSLIKKYGIRRNVEFTGFLSEDEMIEKYLESHIYILPSSIENSPNSLGEAMLLGVPAITSDVGGIKTLFHDKIDGYMYQFNAPYILKAYIKNLFDNDDIALSFSKNAIKHAQDIHNRSKNNLDLTNVYKKIKASIE